MAPQYDNTSEDSSVDGEGSSGEGMIKGRGMYVDDSSGSDDDETMGKETVDSASDARMNDVGVVDTTYAQRTVWLVKVPDFLADRFAEVDEDNADIGGVRIYAK